MAVTVDWVRVWNRIFGVIKAVVLTAGEASRFGHPHTEAMDTYEGHVGTNRVYCTSRMGTLRVYGRQDGTFSVWKQTNFSGSCRF